MKTVNVEDADSQALIEEAAAGEEIIVMRGGVPMVRLVPMGETKPGFHRALGALKGRIEMTDDFDAPLPPDIAKAFGIDE